MTLLRDHPEELSAYLASHVNNPVDWRRWDDATLAEARTLDRPIFLSVGYAACHWCHVMAHESFEDISIAAILNESFVPVKVDREERPDLDALYMAATQLTTGHGGWPMSVFLLPDGRAFLAGTYYPPRDRGGQVGFERLLGAVREAWRDQRSLIEDQADQLAHSLEREVHFIDHVAPTDTTLDLATARRRLVGELLEQGDADGGFGRAPKFPRPSYVEALLEDDTVASRDLVERTLEAMARRGLYDHFGGGFARYSVDGAWHVPHFEKMLSDQALLARCYLRASRRRRRPEWRRVALDTLAFVERELRVAYGYAASLDADAGGVEGSHVTWTREEFSELLEPGDLQAALARWRIEPVGSFEGRSIPRLAEGEPFSTPDSLRGAEATLLRARRTRVAPARDEKVVLEWNAMLASAMLESDDERVTRRGLELLDSLLSTHVTDVWWRTQHHRDRATAADVAWVIDASIDAFERTGDDHWLEMARRGATYLLAHYWDGPVPEPSAPDVGAGLFTQSDDVTDLTIRPKEIFDGATPSAHAVATRALARLGLCLGDEYYLVVARRLVTLAATLIAEHPMAVVDLLDAAGYALDGVEVVIPGDAGPLAHHVRSRAMPRTVLVTGSGSSPLLAERHAGLAYVCRAGVCDLPVRTIDQLEAQLERVWRS